MPLEDRTVLGSFLWWHLGLGLHVLVLGQDSKTQFSPLKAHDVGQEADLRRTDQSGAHPPSYTAVAVSKHQLAEDRTSDCSVSNLVSPPCMGTQAQRKEETCPSSLFEEEVP